MKSAIIIIKTFKWFLSLFLCASLVLNWAIYPCFVGDQIEAATRVYNKWRPVADEQFFSDLIKQLSLTRGRGDNPWSPRVDNNVDRATKQGVPGSVGENNHDVIVKIS